MKLERKAGKAMRRALAVSLLFAGMSPFSLVLGQTVAVTPGSSAAYLFCAKPKSNCKTSTVGRWIFRLAHESEVLLASGRRPFAFRDDGTSGVRERWSSGAAPVMDRIYVGYGEFKADPSNPTLAIFSGIVDVPPIRPASCTALYGNFDYCQIGSSGSGLGTTTDTPFRTCFTTYSWTSTAGSVASSSETGWYPNTGVIDCSTPSAAFIGNIGSGIGNCVAHYVQRRGTSTPLWANTYYSREFLYQARVADLQIKGVSDFTDFTCAPAPN